MMRRRVLLLSSLATLAAPSAQAQTARFLAMRHWVSPEYTRLALEFDGVLLIDERSDDAPSKPQNGAASVYELELVGLAFIPALHAQLTQTYKQAMLLETRAAPMPNGLRLSLSW